MPEPLPPELSRLGDEICAAAERRVDARRRRWELTSRLATTGVLGALVFAVLTPSALSPADHSEWAVQVAALQAATAEIYAARTCDYPRRGTVKYPQSCVAPATGTPFAPRRPYAWR